MPIRIACPGCQKPLKVPDYAAARPIKCPHCGTLSQVPDVKPTRPKRYAETATALPRQPLLRRPPPLGNAAMMLGLLAVVTCCVPTLSAIFAFLAIVLGGIGMTRPDERQAARVGLRLGIVAIVLMIVIVFAFAGLIVQLLPWLNEVQN